MDNISVCIEESQDILGLECPVVDIARAISQLKEGSYKEFQAIFNDGNKLPLCKNFVLYLLSRATLAEEVFEGKFQNDLEPILLSNRNQNIRHYTVTKPYRLRDHKSIKKGMESFINHINILAGRENPGSELSFFFGLFKPNDERIQHVDSLVSQSLPESQLRIYDLLKGGASNKKFDLYSLSNAISMKPIDLETLVDIHEFVYVWCEETKKGTRKELSNELQRLQSMSRNKVNEALSQLEIQRLKNLSQGLKTPTEDKLSELLDEEVSKLKKDLHSKPLVQRQYDEWLRKAQDLLNNGKISSINVNNIDVEDLFKEEASEKKNKFFESIKQEAMTLTFRGPRSLVYHAKKHPSIKTDTINDPINKVLVDYLEDARETVKTACINILQKEKVSREDLSKISIKPEQFNNNGVSIKFSADLEYNKNKIELQTIVGLCLKSGKLYIKTCMSCS